jgi:tRNA 5-methylaminomethyl-2-thiouridine biosynthesis bifunctional protein
MPYISTSASPPGRLYGDGFLFSRRLIQEILGRSEIYSECGVIQIPTTKRHLRMVNESSDLSEFAPITRVEPTEASEIAGIPVSLKSFHLPCAGFCSPREIVHSLIDAHSDRLSVLLNSRAVDLSRDNEAWNVRVSDGTRLSAPIVVLCGAYEIASLSLSSWVPLEPIRGQTVTTASTPSSRQLRTVISYDGYIAPAVSGAHFVGAHYRHNDMNEEPAQADSEEILSRLSRALPEINPLTILSSRVCFRASTHDRLPYIGQLPNTLGGGLYINAGHGSRGLVTAPLAGEIIARSLVNEPLQEISAAAAICSTERLRKRFHSWASMRSTEPAP